MTQPARPSVERCPALNASTAGATPKDDDVGQRVVLHPEAALRAREARDPPVEAVADSGREDPEGGPVAVPHHRLDDREEAGEESARRDQVRQQVQAARRGDVLAAPAATAAQAAVRALVEGRRAAALRRLRQRQLGLRSGPAIALPLAHARASAAPRGRRAISLSPPHMRSPLRTRISLPGGNTTSVREPKRISP